jgi:hypothetical protein
LLRRHLFHFIRVSRETVWAVELRRERIPEWWHPFNERELREQLVAHYMADEVLDLEETWKRDPKEWGRAVGRLICDRGISIDDLAHGTLMSPRQIYAIKAGKVSATHPQNRDAINDFLQG